MSITLMEKSFMESTRDQDVCSKKENMRKQKLLICMHGQ